VPSGYKRSGISKKKRKRYNVLAHEERKKNPFVDREPKKKKNQKGTCSYFEGKGKKKRKAASFRIPVGGSEKKKKKSIFPEEEREKKVSKTHRKKGRKGEEDTSTEMIFNQKVNRRLSY